MTLWRVSPGCVCEVMHKGITLHVLLEDVSLRYLKSQLLDRTFFDAAFKKTPNESGHTYKGAMPTCRFPTRFATKTI